MPTYDYRCERTGEIFEVQQSFSDDALTVCPEHHDGEPDECGAPVKKVFSKVGIAFKGDGFYKTDHGSSASKSTSTSESTATSGTESSTSDKSESKKPAKSESSSSSTSSD